jgi:hypothetical protein
MFFILQINIAILPNVTIAGSLVSIGVLVACGKSTLIPLVIIGAVTMKITNNTSITSIYGRHSYHFLVVF